MNYYTFKTEFEKLSPRIQAKLLPDYLKKQLSRRADIRNCERNS